MPKLEIRLSEKEIADLIGGKKIPLGKQKEYSDVYLVKEKANDLYYSKGLERGHKAKANTVEYFSDSDLRRMLVLGDSND